MAICVHPLERAEDGNCEQCGEEMGWAPANHVARFGHAFIGRVLSTCGHEESEHEAGLAGFMLCKGCEAGDQPQHRIHPFTADGRVPRAPTD